MARCLLLQLLCSTVAVVMYALCTDAYTGIAGGAVCILV